MIFVLRAGPADLDLHCVLPAPKGFASLSVDVCFLVDATSSMSSHIDNAKDTVLGIAANINEAYPGVPVRFAFIAYRDFLLYLDAFGSRATSLGLAAIAVAACGSVWNSNLQPDFNLSICDSFDANSSAVLRELDESNRFVQKSAELTSI